MVFEILCRITYTFLPLVYTIFGIWLILMQDLRMLVEWQNFPGLSMKTTVTSWRINLILQTVLSFAATTLAMSILSRVPIREPMVGAIDWLSVRRRQLMMILSIERLVWIPDLNLSGNEFSKIQKEITNWITLCMETCLNNCVYFDLCSIVDFDAFSFVRISMKIVYMYLWWHHWGPQS